MQQIAPKAYLVGLTIVTHFLTHGWRVRNLGMAYLGNCGSAFWLMSAYCNQAVS